MGPSHNGRYHRHGRAGLGKRGRRSAPDVMEVQFLDPGCAAVFTPAFVEVPFLEGSFAHGHQNQRAAPRKAVEVPAKFDRAGCLD